jgi:hypothetical protein
MITTENRAALLLQAREHVQQALSIVKRLNLTNKYAAEKLMAAEQNLAFPEPVLLNYTDGSFYTPPIKGGIIDDVDPDNLYIDLPGACACTGWSHTTIRKLVNKKVLPQEHRGMYRFKDVMLCLTEYHRDGIGKDAA